MKNVLYHLLHNPLLTKINSFLIALFIWSVMSNWRILEISKTIPLYCHTLKHVIAQAPKTVDITIKGPRASVKKLDLKNLAAHINLDTFIGPITPFVITAEHLFLPNTIKLISSNPSPITITLEKNKSEKSS